MLVSHKYPIHPWVPNTLSHLGAVLAGGLPALQLEPRDDPHLDSAVARGAHVDHQAPSGLEAEAPGSASSTGETLALPLASAAISLPPLPSPAAGSLP